MKRTVLVSVAVIVLAVAAVVGAYLTVYQPSHQPILNGPKPIPANKQAMMPVTPLGELPGPDAARVAGTLRGAAESVLPGFRIDDEQLFTHPGGWDALGNSPASTSATNSGCANKSMPKRRSTVTRSGTWSGAPGGPAACSTTEGSSPSSTSNR